jgi:plasmid stabilization system protein ParE
MNVVWSNYAQEKVMEISLRISIDNLLVAEQWVNDIFDKTKSLSSFPRMGRKVPEVKRVDVRELLFGNYRIIYHYSELTQQVTVLTVRHVKQLLPLDEIKKQL